MSQAGPEAQRRPLLVNGEALKVDVTAPNTGGGPKYEPRTAEDAATFLLPQLTATVEGARDLATELRAEDRIYVEAKLVANYLAPSYFPTLLLAQIGATPVGSRADVGLYETSSKSEEVQTRRLIFALPDSGLASFEALVRTGGQGRTQAQAFAEIRNEMKTLAPLVAREKGFASNDYRDVIRELKKQQIVGDAILPLELHSSARVRFYGRSTFHMTYEYVQVDGQSVHSAVRAAMPDRQ